MSTTIDHKVVEMRFDNKHFEQHTRESMSTLDKLKAKLNFKDSSKSLQNLNSSANKVNMNGLTSALDSCHSRFSALEVMGVTALANITNSAVNAGKRIISSLTIDPVKTGFNEYELKMDSIKTILASTGESIEKVNKYLNELNEYSDQTIYSFADMTQNIGKFTNAGVKLEDAVMAIKGISNEAAVSGANANEASRAMYNFAQALSAGYVKLIDWKSIENANMATVEFKQQLIESAVAVGTLTKTSDGMYRTLTGKTLNATQNFNDTLQEQWMTTEVLVNTLKDYADNTTEIGKKAFAAAQDVTKFSQVLGILSETAQSGWARTWEIIFGNIEQAKAIFTPLTNFFSGIINSISDFRNAVLDNALSRNFRAIFENTGVKKLSEGITTITKSLEYYQDMVNRVWRGDYKNQPYRSGLLEAEGHNFKVIQSLVNKGYQYKLTVEDVTEAEKLYGKTVTKTTEAKEETTKATEEQLLTLIKMSNAELKAAGYTKEQIKALRELESVAKKTGIPLEKFIENLDKIDGRWLLFESFANVGRMFANTAKIIKQAWNDIFHPGLDRDGIIEKRGNALFNIIAAVHKLTTKLPKLRDENGKLTETGDNLLRTFKGIFAVLDLITSIIGGGFKLALTIVKKVLGLFNIDLLEFTALLGDGLVKIRDWIKNNLYLAEIIGFIADIVAKAVLAIKDWITNNEVIAKGIDKLKTSLINMRDSLSAWAKGLKETENVPLYILKGLANGLKNGANFVFDTIIEIGKGILEAIKKVLGIHSPSTEFFEIGKNIIQGLVNGLQNGLSGLWNFIKTIGSKCIELFNKIDFGKILAAGIGIGLVVVVKKMLDVVHAFVSPLEKFGNMLDSIGDGIENFGSGVKKWGQAKLIKSIAESILILAVSVLLLSRIEAPALLRSVLAIGALAAIIGVLAAAASKAKNIGDLSKLSLTFVSISGALLLMATTFKQLASIEPDRMNNVIKGFAAMIIGLAVLVAAFGKFVKGPAAEHIHKVGKMVTKISVALLLMVGVIKLASMLSAGEIAKGMTVIALCGGFIAGMILLSKSLSESTEHVHKVGKMISKIAIALLLMIAVIKLSSKLEGKEIAKGTAVILLMGGFFSALIFVSKFAGENAAKAGLMMLMMAGALAITVSVVKQIASLSKDEIAKGSKALLALGVLFAALIGVSHFAGPNAIKAGAMLLMVSGALLILSGVLFLLSKMDTEGLHDALGIVTVLELLFGGLIFVTKYAKNCMKTLITITVAITLLIAAVIGLTFIDSEKLKTAAGSIAAVLSSFALLIASTKLLGNAKQMILPLLSMLGVVAVLAGIIVMLTKIDPNSVLTTCSALSILLLSLSASLAIASLVGSMALKGVGALAALAGAIALLAGVLGLLQHFDLVPSMETVKSLSALLLAMSASLVILGAVGLMGPAALIGVGILAALIVALGALVIGIGALCDKFPKLEDFLNKGIPILEKIGYALGSFFGNIVSGFAVGATSGLPMIGTNLSAFMTNLTPFIQGVKLVDENTFKNVGMLVKSILALTAADFINGIATFLSGGVSFSELGTELSKFMVNAMPFIELSKQIDPTIMDGMKNLADAILSLTKNDVLDSLTSWFTGGNSLEEFGSQLGGLATHISTFVKNLGTFTDTQVTTVDCAARALKTLSEVASELPNEGGVAGFFAGENDMSVFGEKLPGLATHLVSFVTNLGTFSDAQVATVDCAARAIKALSEVASELPNEGGVAGFFAGNNDLGKFGEKLPGLGTHLASFVTNLGTFSDAQVATVDCAARAIKALSDVAAKLPNEGGIAALFAGDNDIGKFGEKLPGLAKHLTSFVTNLGTFSDAQVATVDSACKVIKNIAKLGEINVKKTGSGLNSLGKNLVKFAKKIKEFITELDTLSGDEVGSVMDNVKGLVEKADTVAGKLIDSAIEGADSKVESIKKKFNSIAKAAVDSLCTSSIKKEASKAGKDLVTGFANGIKNNKNLASNAGNAIGKAALKAAKEAIDAHSPSREAMKIGNYFGQGLIIGIENYGSKTYEAGYSIADRAKDGLSKAISRISNIIDSDMDTQPTIRPVLDLSEVESGIGSIGSMFNNGPSLGVTANLKAINSSMNARGQNGTNNDVVSAINKLGRNLGNVGGDTYNINGVTYDDQSGLQDAVRTIIRAANIERRI